MAKTKQRKTSTSKSLLRHSDAKKIVEDFTPKRSRKKTKVFITPDLEKKDKLSFREKVWVYNSVILLMLGVLNVVASITVLAMISPKNGVAQTISICWLVGATLLILVGLIETQHRTIGGKMLTFEKRRQQRFAERQRTRTGHAIERYGRYGRDEVEYNHFTTRVESVGRAVTLTIIEHEKTGKDTYVDRVVELTDLDRIRLLVPAAVELYEKQYVEYQQQVDDWKKEHEAWAQRKLKWCQESLRHFGRHYVDQSGDEEPFAPVAPAAPTGQSAVKTIERERQEPYEEFEQKVEHWHTLFNQIAAAFEEQAYQRSREELEVKALALKLRS